MLALQTVEAYASMCPHGGSPYVRASLHSLRIEVATQHKPYRQTFRRTEANENESVLGEEVEMAKSQVCSIHRSQLIKVASKDLFDKVTIVKHSLNEAPLATQQVIASLKAQLSEKDTAIRRLHTHLEEVRQAMASLSA
jgi:vacuolar-type H+-ATPase subunit I/STV1